MKKVTLLLASLFLVACGHNWSEGDEKDWMDDCKDADMSTDQCQCYFDNLASHFDDAKAVEDFNKRSKDEELEDSDYSNFKSFSRGQIDCMEDDDMKRARVREAK
tara:strand:+ start:267 stop:581 length:315 start_codon:yes stop_codon:yes gene_type:complete